MGNVLGIGIDMVLVSEIQELDERTKGAFVKQTFTGTEKEDAKSVQDPYPFYAGRFAVKEAVFKAVAHLTEEKTFDFRIVETKRLSDGRPKVIMDGSLGELMKQAGIEDILISVSNEADYAIAIAEAVGTGTACGTEKADVAGGMKAKWA